MKDPLEEATAEACEITQLGKGRLAPEDVADRGGSVLASRPAEPDDRC